MKNKVFIIVAAICISLNYFNIVYADSESDLKLVSNILGLIIDKLDSKNIEADYDLDKEMKYVSGIVNNAYKDLDDKYKNEKNIDEKIRLSKLLNVATSYRLVIDYIQAYSNTQNNKYLQSAIGSKAIADLLYE